MYFYLNVRANIGDTSLSPNQNCIGAVIFSKHDGYPGQWNRT